MLRHFKTILLSVLCLSMSFAGCQKSTNTVEATSEQTETVSPQLKMDYSKADALNIIDQIWNRLKSEHILFVLHKDKVAEIEANYLKIRESVPENGLSKDDMLKTGWSILHPFHDLHLIFVSKDQLNIQYRYLSDLIIRELNGASLVSVNGESLDDIFKRTDKWQIYESEAGAKHRIENELITNEGFRKYGYSLNDLNIVVQNSDGKLETIHYSDSDFNGQKQHVAALQKVPADLLDNRSVPWEISIIPEQKLAILTLRECINNDKYRTMLHQLFTDIKEKGIEHLVLDLRKNRGGDSIVANEFITYLDIDQYKNTGVYIRNGDSYDTYHDMAWKNQKKEDLTFHGKVYALSSNTSFSSAVIFLDLLQANHLATVIGEIPNNLANSYGDIIEKPLDGYPFIFITTFKYFVRASGDMENKAIIPDIQCHASQAMNEVYKLMAQ